jgi:hypothetical protein
MVAVGIEEGDERIPRAPLLVTYWGVFAIKRRLGSEIGRNSVCPPISARLRNMAYAGLNLSIDKMPAIFLRLEISRFRPQHRRIIHVETYHYWTCRSSAMRAALSAGMESGQRKYRHRRTRRAASPAD